MSRERVSAVDSNLVSTPIATDGTVPNNSDMIVGGSYMEPRDAIRIGWLLIAGHFFYLL